MKTSFRLAISRGQSSSGAESMEMNDHNRKDRQIENIDKERKIKRQVCGERFVDTE